MKQFIIPTTYKSPLISAIKAYRRKKDKMKKDFSPTLLDFGPVQIYLARHFGFCYGVENAIEIAFKTIEENPGKRIFLLSEMIHNPQVNADLLHKGVQFLQDTSGNQLVPFESLSEKDIVIIPAFGTTLAIEKKLKSIGIAIEKYNTTCPFVEKVWNRSAQIAAKQYSIVIHGKPTHEETRATFSHAANHAPVVIVNDMSDAVELGKYILGQKPAGDFYKAFEGKYSVNFNVAEDLKQIGVVNQTTMLAGETQAIADYLKKIIREKYHLTKATIGERFADTRDTLCYATNDNQSAIYELLRTSADVAIIVGGYNSSNTSHLVELCEEKLPAFFISDETKILTRNSIQHFNLHLKKEAFSSTFLPDKNPVKILLSSGASCPDALVEEVIKKIISFYYTSISTDDLATKFAQLH